MRLFAFKKRVSVLDEPIEKVLNEMNQFGPDSPEYPKLVVQLEALVRLKAEERRDRVSPDTMAIVLGNIGIVLIIVVYEQKHVMISKAMGLLLKPKNSI